MSGLKDFIDGFNRDVQAYNDFRAENAIIAGQDLNALALLRINEQGQDFDGEAFDPYTPGYKEQREKDGYQTAYKDYNRTGKLNASRIVKVIQQDASSTTIEIAANNDADNDKLRGAYSRGDELLRNSDEEYAIAFDAYDERYIQRMPFLFGR